MNNPWLRLIAEQAFNSAIVAGIFALSMLAAQTTVSLKVVAIGFGMTFLIELRKYRKINNRP